MDLREVARRIDRATEELSVARMLSEQASARALAGRLGVILDAVDEAKRMTAQRAGAVAAITVAEGMMNGVSTTAPAVR